eukprot:7383530-Prymnesium_polylepis.1
MSRTYVCVCHAPNLGAVPSQQASYVIRAVHPNLPPHSPSPSPARSALTPSPPPLATHAAAISPRPIPVSPD